jgi:hypothetical protein
LKTIGADGVHVLLPELVELAVGWSGCVAYSMTSGWPSGCSRQPSPSLVDVAVQVQQGLGARPGCIRWFSLLKAGRSRWCGITGLRRDGQPAARHADLAVQVDASPMARRSATLSGV